MHSPLRPFLPLLIYRGDEQTFVSEGICHVLCISHCWAITCWPTRTFSRSQHRSPWKTKLTHGRPSVLVLGQNHVLDRQRTQHSLVCSLLLWRTWCHLVREKRLWVISLVCLQRRPFWHHVKIRNECGKYNQNWDGDINKWSGWVVCKTGVNGALVSNGCFFADVL